MDLARGVTNNSLSCNNEAEFDLDEVIVSFIDEVGCFDPELARELISDGAYADFMSIYLGSGTQDRAVYHTSIETWRNLAKKYKAEFWFGNLTKIPEKP